MIGFRKAEIIHQDDVHGPCPAHDEHESHDSHEGRHDHGDKGEIAEKPSSRKIVAQKKEGKGDPDDRSGHHRAQTEKDGIPEGLQIKGIRKKVIEILESESTRLRGDGIKKQANKRIDQENTEEGPDGGIAQETADRSAGTTIGFGRAPRLIRFVAP